MNATRDLAPDVGTTAACQALEVPRATYYRARRPRLVERPPRPTPARALAPDERTTILETLNSERFVDSAPRQVWASLLDEGIYLCSVRSMYRILAANHEVRERRDQLTHPTYAKPQLLATAPNRLWSWDITKLLGPAKWTYLYLYVILDVFSRYVVGWALSTSESGRLARALISETIAKLKIPAGQLVLHADRGGPMRSKPLAFLLADLGVTKTHSRPYVSDDNPYSEAQFRTLKYRPDFPDRFGSLEDGRAFCRPFFHWYNHEHHHTGLGLLTPAVVHFGLAPKVLEARKEILTSAYQRHPERFVRRPPRPEALPAAVWINKPDDPVDAPLEAQ
jgi:transposase InsO family protein